MLCIVTNEISNDPLTAVSIAREWGVTNFEVKRVFLKRTPFIEEEGHQVLESVLRTYDEVRIVAVSPGLFDRPMSHWEFAWDAGAKLDESFKMCHRLQCRTLVVFGVKKTGKETFQQVVDHFGMVAQKAEAAGVNVAIEPHKGNYVETAASGAEIFNAVNSPNLGLNYDVANARGGGEEPFPDGYAAAKPYIKHVHIKGSKTVGDGKFKTCVPGEGDLGWPKLFKQFANDNIDVAFSIETHIKPGYEKTRDCTQAAKKLMEEAGLAL